MRILKKIVKNKPGSAFAGSGSEDGSARGIARFVRICRFKFNLVLLNIRGRNGCGRIEGAAVVVVVVVDGGSVAGSAVVGSDSGSLDGSLLDSGAKFSKMNFVFEYMLRLLYIKTQIQNLCDSFLMNMKFVVYFSRYFTHFHKLKSHYFNCVHTK